MGLGGLGEDIKIMAKNENLIAKLEAMPLNKFVDYIGELQQQSSSAKKRYDAARRIMAARVKDSVGTDKPFYGKEYYVELSHDEATVIEPELFIKRVPSNALRNLCMKVLIGKAKENLPAEVYEDIAELKKDEEPTLHVSRIKDD